MVQLSQLLSRSKILRKQMTEAEKRLWFYLRSCRFNQWKFRRQVPLDGYILDFVCFSQRLIIEVDGCQHADNVMYDEKRTNYLKQQGFRVICFWNKVFDALIRNPSSACRHLLPQGEKELRT